MSVFLTLEECFVRFSSVLDGTSPLLVRRYPLIDRLLCGTYLVNVHFSGYISGIHGVIAWLLCPTYRSREPRAAEEINFVTGRFKSALELMFNVICLADS